MQKINKSKVLFKDYNHNQNLLLPPSLEELIDPNHPVRVVNLVVDNIDIEPLIKKYKGGGTSSYHPRLMLKVLIYYILGYSLHQRPADTATLPSHMEGLKETLGQMPETLVADAGYGSEQNYEYLENNGVEAYVKFNNFHKEQTKQWKNDPFRPENLHYNDQHDCYYCPMGQPMRFIGNRSYKTRIGYDQLYRMCQAQNCKGCPMRGPCHKAKGNRKIEVNPRLIHYKNLVRERLNSERGRQYRSQRPVEPETVFGNIKNNHGFRRFMLRGLEKVEIEAGLLALAHNLAKLAN